MKPLRLTIHGRIIDHLGIQMYQKPVAALAELISNAWDADATRVDVTYPGEFDEGSEIIIEDNGLGMTYAECQERYLEVGLGRRELYSDVTPGGRPVLGRKGIGKFAGFGIAGVIKVETVSASTREKTVFSLDVSKIRAEKYMGEGIDADEVHHSNPVPGTNTDSGTKITLKSVRLRKRIPLEKLLASMASRFLLYQTSSNFKIYINGMEVPDEPQAGVVEYSFPTDYQQDETPDGIKITDGWGYELLPNGREIKWRINFYRDTVGDEELRGVSIFARGKLIQNPFFFNLGGGLGGQHGQQYMSGQVVADYVDSLPEDVIAPERQRLSWEHQETLPLEEWGQKRIKELLVLWKTKRGEQRQKEIESKLNEFSQRLNKLQKHESKTVRKALRSIGSIETLSDQQFQDLGNAVLTAWEGGRLKELISDMAEAGTLEPAQVLDLLAEVNVLDALNVAEAVKVKMETINGLRSRVANRGLENDLRDYVAKNPWLLSAKWETFKVETAVNTFLREAASEVGLDDAEYHGRIDLALKSGDQLLVVEFMRPGLNLDYGHISRCELYILKIRASTAATTALGIKNVHGLLVADSLGRKAEMVEKLRTLSDGNIVAHDWNTLLETAAQEWAELIDILASRRPEDVRLRKLKEID